MHIIFLYYLYEHPSLHPSIHPSAHPFIHHSIHYSFYLSTCSSCLPSIHIYAHPSICMSTPPSINLPDFTHVSVCTSACPSFTFLSIHTSIYASLCLSFLIWMHSSNSQSIYPSPLHPFTNPCAVHPIVHPTIYTDLCIDIIHPSIHSSYSTYPRFFITSIKLKHVFSSKLLFSDITNTKMSPLHPTQLQ